MNGLIPVHLRVVDAQTKRPTPVRLRITDDASRFFAPFGRSPDFPTGKGELAGGYAYLAQRKFVTIDGQCEILLPPGRPLMVEISKGIEYTPIQETLTLGAGQMASRFAIARWADRRTEGWLAVDTRCQFLTPHDALVEASAEDLDDVHLLAAELDAPSNDGHLYRTTTNLSAFSGQAPALEADGRRVIVNTLNTHPALGELALLHSHRPVFPLSFGAIDGSDDGTLSGWCDQCHRKGGLAVWRDAFLTEGGGGALVALLLGKIDAIEYEPATRSRSFLPSYYQLLNAGFLVPLVGSGGRASNRAVLGGCRTYTRLADGDRSLAGWVERTRHGESFITNGPLLAWERRGGRISASARSLVPFDKLELIHAGAVVHAIAPASASRVAEFAIDDDPRWTGWLALRCRGASFSMLDGGSPLFAHSAPFGPRAFAPQRSAIEALQEKVRDVRHWIETTGRYHEPRRRDQALAECDEACQILARNEPEA